MTVPLSAGLLTDTDGYFDALTAYRSGDPAPIIESMARASFSATGNGRQLVSDLRTIRAGSNERLTARRDSTAWRVLAVLPRQPVVDFAYVQRELGSARQAGNGHWLNWSRLASSPSSAA